MFAIVIQVHFQKCFVFKCFYYVFHPALAACFQQLRLKLASCSLLSAVRRRFPRLCCASCFCFECSSWAVISCENKTQACCLCAIQLSLLYAKTGSAGTSWSCLLSSRPHLTTSCWLHLECTLVNRNETTYRNCLLTSLRLFVVVLRCEISRTTFGDCRMLVLCAYIIFLLFIGNCS